MKNRFSSIRSGLAMLLVVSGACVASQGEPPPPEGVGVATQALAPAVTVAPALTYSLPAATPVTLSEATVDDFIAFAAAARKDQRFDIVSRIVAARCPATGACAILDALHDRILNPRRPGELGLQLITLKIIGEFGDVRSKATLVSYINAAMPPADEAEYAHLAINARMASEMLKARAVEALAFIAYPFTG
jgi:hypothetical protein